LTSYPLRGKQASEFYVSRKAKMKRLAIIVLLLLCVAAAIVFWPHEADTIQQTPKQNITISASVVVLADVISGGTGDKYYYYDISISKVIKNSLPVKLKSTMKVARVNYDSQPDLNKEYVIGLEYYNEGVPKYGLKIVTFKQQ